MTLDAFLKSRFARDLVLDLDKLANQTIVRQSSTHTVHGNRLEKVHDVGVDGGTRETKEEDDLHGGFDNPLHNLWPANVAGKARKDIRGDPIAQGTNDGTLGRGTVRQQVGHKVFQRHVVAKHIGVIAPLIRKKLVLLEQLKEFTRVAAQPCNLVAKFL